MSTLSERIKLALQTRKLSQAELARRLKITRGAVHLWCSATTKELAASNALRIARELQVNPYWLVFGEGSMEPLNEEKLQPKELTLIATVRNLDSTNQKLALRLINQLKSEDLV